MIKIVPVQDREQWSAFFQVPDLLYRRDPLWTPLPGDSFQQMFAKGNPLLRHVEYECFIALDQGKPVGRIAAVTDALLADQRVGLFGCFETIDNAQVAQGLVDAATDSLIKRGKSLVQGPATLNTSQQVGLLVEGFKHPPQLMMPYNPPYYARLLEDQGFKPLLDLYSYLWKPTFLGKSHKLAAIAQRASRIPGLKLRPIRLQDPWGEGKRLADLHNETMTKQWGFVPMDEVEGAHFLAGLNGFADPELLMFCEVDQRPVGMLLMMPNLAPQMRVARQRRLPPMVAFFRQQPRSLRVGILSVTQAYRRRGVAALFIDYAMKTVLRKGYREAELSLIMDANRDMNSIILNTVGSQVHNRYRIYEKGLQ